MTTVDVQQPFAGSTLVVPDNPKMIRETLCVAQARIAESDHDRGRAGEHVARLQRLIDECDRLRPLGPDGKHGDRHTGSCGCDDTQITVTTREAS